MKRFLTAAALLAALSVTVPAQTPSEYRVAVDSLRARLERRTTVSTKVRLQKITSGGNNTLDFHFTQELSDYPWRKGDIDWLRSQLKELAPPAYRDFNVGKLYGKNTDISTLPMPAVGNGGSPMKNQFRTPDPHHSSPVRRIGDLEPSEGLLGRNIALWQSHGRYYEKSLDRWEWQRAAIHSTVEDMFTQSFVLPFLIPMLENAGAYILDPRERDTQKYESVCDNDNPFPGPRGPLMRTRGSYYESGQWKDAGTGFADLKPFYSDYDNPFTMGTARSAEAKESADATITWAPAIPHNGRYAVYVSYKTVAGSTNAASYKVHHSGGVTAFSVNQTMGGGTWMYLGTFDFDDSGACKVVLDNGAPEGYENRKGSIVTADAVRFGGGMGKVERGGTVSALPAYAEGALYNIQWSGIDMTLFDDWDSEYTKEYASRGKWTSYMAGGSRTNPDSPGKRIPLDLSLAIHTDAGTTPNDSIVGTLAIYTLKADRKEELPTGESRLNGRLLADFVQTQLVQDVRATFEPLWARRGLWDRSYSESRTTSVPALLLEMFAHQNFADMRYGLDPAFKFTVSRSIYKGVLKYLSSRYGVKYAVQPLPVDNFAAELSGSRAVLSWSPVEDPLEPTASPAGYILYTRMDGKAFDDGEIIAPSTGPGGVLTYEAPVQTGHIYSYRIVAFNNGGKSFPSETLSVGRPFPGAKNILIVNNFNRVSGPTWFDTETFAGFMNQVDAGVPWGEDISFVGEVYQFDRGVEWTDDDNPGFGGSYSDKAGEKIAGNTFDFPYVHGRMLMDAGYAFSSASAKAFARMDTGPYPAADIICGKQVTVRRGTGAYGDPYTVFPAAIREAITRFTGKGGGILISGAYIGTDAWDRIFPVEKDPEEVAATQEFIQKTLGYKWLTNYGDRTGTVLPTRNGKIFLSRSIPYNNTYSSSVYRVENPDGIIPASLSAETFLRYRSSAISAGTAFDSGSYRVVALGFPIEAVTDVSSMETIMSESMKFICK